MKESWKKVLLADYYTISSGLSKSADQFGYGHPFVSFKDVFRNYFLPETLTQLVNTNDKERKSCSVKKGDVFLTRTSETLEELGMSSVALKDYDNATFNGFTKRLRPRNNEDIDPQFIGFYLRSAYFRAEVSAYSILTTRASLNNDIIGRLKINLPSLPTQQKIASILSAYDDLIENNNKRIALLEEMASEIYKEWFVRLRFPNYKKIAIVDGIPEGWEKKSIFEISEVTYGYPFKSKLFTTEESEISVVRIRDIKNDVSKTYTCQEIDVKYLIENGDLLVGMDGDFHIGKWGGGNNKYYLNQRVVRFRPMENISKYFIYWAFKKEIDFLNRIISGTTVAHLSDRDLKQIKIVTPNKGLMLEFMKKVDPLLELEIRLKQKNKLLQQTRDLLLSRLISGKLEV